MNRRCFIVTDDSTNGTFDQRGRRLIKGNREMLPNGSIVFLATQDVIIKFIAKEI
jgi:hypothetical protein